MADTAFMEQFRRETVDAFEVGVSLVRDTVTSEAVISGNQATFLVAGSGGASAVTRGVNGKIPARPNDLTQRTVTLKEWHDVAEVTDFNIFASQGDQRSVMQRTTVEVINRTLDADIIAELNTATTNTGAATTASLQKSVHAKTILQQTGNVPWDSNIFALITPAYEAYLMQVPEFTSADYTGLRPMPEAPTAFRNMPTSFRWIGVNWIVHPALPGAGTNAEKCFMYHRSAVGHAMDIRGIRTDLDYNRRHDFSWCRASGYMGTLILQSSGIVVINHDGSAMAPAP